MKMPKFWYLNGLFLILIGIIFSSILAFGSFPEKIAWIRFIQYPVLFISGSAFGTLQRQIFIEKWFKKQTTKGLGDKE